MQHSTEALLPATWGREAGAAGGRSPPAAIMLERHGSGPRRLAHTRHPTTMTAPEPHPDLSIHIFACVEIARSLTSQFFLYLLRNPDIEAVMEREFGGPKRETAKISLPCNTMPGKSIEIPLGDLMTNAKMTEDLYNLEFLRRGVASAVISVHDEIKCRSLADQEPDLEFLRHVRNACGHGNRFSFRGDEPRRLAKFQGLEITKSLEGLHPVLFDFITIGDAVFLLDTITRRLDVAAAGLPRTAVAAPSV